VRSWDVSCPACGRNKGKRACPALAQTICPVCCATKRNTEIACPSDCTYLVTAQRHPSAVVQRRQADDVAVLMPTLRHLTERQQQLFFLFQTLIAQHQPQGFAPLIDADVAEAGAALAQTLETAARGVIYEQPAASPVAAALVTDLRGMIEHVRRNGNPVGDLEIAAVLRAIERGARPDQTREDKVSYLALMARLLHVNRQAQPQSPPADPASSLILP
jgi:hypothetical protein